MLEMSGGFRVIEKDQLRVPRSESGVESPV
jgi:hypothetical protein